MAFAVHPPPVWVPSPVPFSSCFLSLVGSLGSDSATSSRSYVDLAVPHHESNMVDAIVLLLQAQRMTRSIWTCARCKPASSLPWPSSRLQFLARSFAVAPSGHWFDATRSFPGGS